MSEVNDTYNAAIETMQVEIFDRMRTINSLRKLQGQGPLYPDPDAAVSAGSKKIRKDQWYRVGLSTAVREFLEMRHDIGPATLDEIYDALVAGGFQFETKDAGAAKPALKQSLTKNTAIFHRLPTSGAYGLADWYPARKSDEEKNQSPPAPGKRKGRPPKTEKSRDRKATGDGDKSGKTVLASIKTAVEATSAEFTKQEIFDWVNAHFPGLKANRTSVFSMITRLRDELGIATVQESKGRVPGTYRREVAGSNGQEK